MVALRSAMVPNLDAGQVGERHDVRCHHRSAGCNCRCRDDQIMRSPGHASTTHFDEKPCVGLSDRRVISDERDYIEHIFHECRPGNSFLPSPEKSTDAQLGNRDRRDRNVVFVGDQVVQSATSTVGVNEERRVEEQPSRRRSSISTNRRMDERSSDQLGSRRCRRSRAFTSAPRPAVTGSRRATGFPRRTTVKCPPRCSTASRRPAKFLAASVALISDIKSDYQTQTRTAISQLRACTSTRWCREARTRFVGRAG